MKRLILMRHGDAPNSIVGDQARELSDRGRSEVVITANYIKSHYKIEYILCSSAKRNRQTLEILQKCGIAGLPVEFSDDIYKNDVVILRSLLLNITSDAETILLLGHNPTLLTFALELDQRGYDEWSEKLNYGMKTAEIIVIEFDKAEQWHDAMNSSCKIKDIFLPYCEIKHDQGI